MRDCNKIETTTRQFIGDEVSRWAFITEWHVEAQSNDRPQSSGAVIRNSDNDSVQRSGARRAHQLGYKKWSKQRHD